METEGCKVWGGSWAWTGGSSPEPCGGWSWYGILQFDWWATKTNSRRSFSFCSSEISASSSAFSSSSMSVSCGQVQRMKRNRDQGDRGVGQRWVKLVKEGRKCAAEREKIAVLATPNFYFSVFRGGCAHPSINTFLNFSLNIWGGLYKSSLIRP